MPRNLLQLQNGQKGFGGRTLFSDATFSINESEHVGVIGPNGAGKSTLFKILIEEEHLDHGELTRAKDLSLGHLSQYDLWEPGETGNQYLDRVSKLPLWEVKAAGRELQVSEEIYDRPIMSLSGGYRMRIKLVGLLGQSPNLMLLDEPTNYLDLETTLLLESFLQNYQGAFLLISHDREFLRRTTDHILEVEAGELTKYNGNIDDYFEQKELLRSQLEARAQSLAGKRKVILDFVSRFGAKATKARQAQSKLKSLQKMETIELKPVPTTAKIRIPAPTHVGKSVLRLQNAVFGYGEKKVLQNVSLEIQRGDHVAVVGLNGAGKSTLLKSLAGTLAPQSGVREVGYQVKIAIFNQHVIEVLNPEWTILQCFQSVAHPEVVRQDILDMAGSLLFSSEMIHAPIKVLSGGEKSRVALGQILLQKVPCLLLDEPTNHLDFQTVEALTQALKDYEGTFVAVSHDRGFISRISSKILEVSGGRAELYPGTYDEYVWSLQQRLAQEGSEPVPARAMTKSENTLKIPTSREAQKELEKKKRQLEKRILEAETTLQKLEAENRALNEQITEGGKSAAELVQKMSENVFKIQELETKWMEFSEELQSLKA